VKVLWLTSSYPRYAGDGAGSFIGSLARALVAQGHEVHVVAPYDPALAPCDEGGVQVHRFRYAPSEALHLAGHGRALHADRQLKWIVPALMPSFALAASALALLLQRREHFDLLHGHWAVPCGAIAAGVARLTRRPLVISLHGSDVYLVERRAANAAAARWGYRRASLVTACSADLLARAVRRGLPADKAVLLPYGVATDRYGCGQGAAWRQRLGIPADAPVVGALGRLVHKKGFDVLIAAMSQVLAARPQAHAVIGGEGDLDRALRQQAHELGLADRVHFPGHVGWLETPDFYALCDVLAVPSVVDAEGNVDGLPNVLLEAMASGCAVIGSAVAGLPDVIHSERNGLLCPPGDATALAAGILRLLSDAPTRQRLGRQARQDMSASYDWSVIAGRVAALYERALGGRAPGERPLGAPPPGAPFGRTRRMSGRRVGPYRAHRRLDDEPLRAAKAEKIVAALEFVGIQPAGRLCLDVGCALGLITKHLAPRFGFTIGLEYERAAVRRAGQAAGERLAFVQGDGQHLPLPDGSIDVVVCAQVYEHVQDPQALLAEIWRVLRPGGVCFFSGPNRLFPFEFHSRLPLVHWLPFPWARTLVRWLGRGDDYDAHMVSLWTLRRWTQRFVVQDLTMDMLRDPARFACQDEVGGLGWVGRLPEAWLRGILPLMPNLNWVLHKPTGESEADA
jgi:glycosyltransferase involved in cell wall biosynthesis/SAM-dependent methyltransferase